MHPYNYYLVILLLQVIAIYFEFGTVFFIISLIAFFYLSLSTPTVTELKTPQPMYKAVKKNRKITNKDKQKESPPVLSAYSVFNKNQERIGGQITAEQFEAEILRKSY